MLDRLRGRITYANVTSTIALVLAAGGGTAYAVDEWNGSNIQDGTITGADVRGSFPDLQNPNGVPGSLTSEDIADGTIFPADIADNSIGSADIAGIDGGDIPGSAINGGHVANDSLDGFDITNLNGSDLADGSVGAEDLAPGVRGFSEVRRVLADTRLDRGERDHVNATCPAGWVATGGGFGHTGSRHPDDIAFQQSAWITARTWGVTAKHVGGVGAADIIARAFVVCAR